MEGMNETYIKDDTSYFGECPECGRSDGYTNTGKVHWGYCARHKAMWLIGVNLFSSWMDETEQEQRAAFDAIGMAEFEHVEPVCDEAAIRRLRAA